MAITKLGTLVVGISGTTGGLTYSRNGSGNFVRVWSRGANPKTARQQLTRGRLSALGSVWAAMDDAGRAAWRAFAAAPPEVDTNRLGEPITISGWMWFCRANQRRMSVGLMPTTDVPADIAVNPYTAVSLYALAGPYGTLLAYWPAGESAAPYSVNIDVAVHTTSGLLNKTSGYAQLLAWLHPAAGGVTIAEACWLKFGYLQAGWKIFGNFYRLRDDGVRSVATPATIVCV